MKRLKIAICYYVETKDRQGAVCLLCGIKSPSRYWGNYTWMEAWAKLQG